MTAVGGAGDGALTSAAAVAAAAYAKLRAAVLSTGLTGVESEDDDDDDDEVESPRRRICTDSGN